MQITIIPLFIRPLLPQRADFFVFSVKKFTGIFLFLCEFPAVLLCGCAVFELSAGIFNAVRIFLLGFLCRDGYFYFCKMYFN